MSASDEGNIRLAIIFLGLLALVCLGGGIYLVHDDKSLPDALIAIGSSAATAITLVVTRPIGGPQDVRVVDEPVEVAEVPAKRTTRKKAGT